MSDQETRDQRKRKLERKKGNINNWLYRKRQSKPDERPGPSPEERKHEPWCDDYEGEAVPDLEVDELDFHDEGD